MIERSSYSLAIQVIQKWQKMLFLTGPRQVGKTTLTKSIAEDYVSTRYFNWDNVEDQKILIKDPYFFTQLEAQKTKKACLIFDEIHKYASWKNYLKGVWDTYHDVFDIIVSGSGRLDLFKRGKDSLLGRYLQIIIFPLTLGELLRRRPDSDSLSTALDDGLDLSSAEAREHFNRLLIMGGFPDPFIKDDAVFTKNWRNERTALVINDDIRQIAQVRELSQLQILGHLLPERIGSPLSINSLREDVGVAFETIRDWIGLLEKVYFCFRIPPYTGKIQRALRKETKLYLYDWGAVADEAARFENLLALHCLKAVDTWNHTEVANFELYYIRDQSKREVDFLIVKNKKPWILIEAKNSDTSFAKTLLNFQDSLRCPYAVQVTAQSNVYRREKNNAGVCLITSAERFLSLLP